MEFVLLIISLARVHLTIRRAFPRATGIRLSSARVESAASMTRRRKINKVLYVVSRFPSLTTTFSASEMDTIRRAGVEVVIASAWASLDENHPQDVEKPLLAGAFRLRLTAGLLVKSLAILLGTPSVWPKLVRLVLGHRQSVFALLKAFASIPKGLWLGDYAARQGVDHIHAHFLTTPTTIAMVAAWISDIPFTTTIHATDIFAASPRAVNGAIPQKIEAAAGNIAISHFNEQFLRQTYPHVRANIDVLYNGINLDKFTPSEPAPLTQPIIIFSNGRLVPKKGHIYLINAVRALIDKNIAIELRIAGSGTQETELKRLIAGLGLERSVTLLGKLPLEAIIEHYRACHLFVLACAVDQNGDMDGLPTVLIEALAMEKPTISTQISGIPEIIRHQHTGYCIPPHDVTALAQAIEYAINHYDEALELARQGRELVLGNFDTRKNALRLLEYWRDL